MSNLPIGSDIFRTVLGEIDNKYLNIVNTISPRTVLKISEPIGKFDMLTKSTVLLLARWAPLFTLNVF
jgi:hypothetical protein